MHHNATDDVIAEWNTFTAMTIGLEIRSDERTNGLMAEKASHSESESQLCVQSAPLINFRRQADLITIFALRGVYSPGCIYARRRQSTGSAVRVVLLAARVAVICHAAG